MRRWNWRGTNGRCYRIVLKFEEISRLKSLTHYGVEEGRVQGEGSGEESSSNELKSLRVLTVGTTDGLGVGIPIDKELLSTINKNAN